MAEEFHFTERLKATVGLSRFHTPQIELCRLREQGPKRLFLNLTTFRAVMDLSPQISALMKRCEGGDENCGVEIPIDNKKGLSVSAFCGRPFMQIETFKDGEKQVGLGFRMDLQEWSSFLQIREAILRAIQKIRENKKNDAPQKVRQYRWMCVKLDGSGLASEGSSWNYLEKEAHGEGEKVCPPDARVHMLVREEPLPELSTIHNAVRAYLLRQSMEAYHFTLCPGCDEDPVHMQPNQLGHMGSNGCLDPWEEVSEALYNAVADTIPIFVVATLYHTVTSALGITSGRANSTAHGSEEAAKAMVMTEEPKYPELEHLCQSIHREEIMELSPTAAC